MKRQKKEIRITFRVTPEQYEHIEEKAEIAQMSIAAYVRAAAMRHRVVVVDGLKEFTHELKGIGRSLNQQTILANERRVTCLGLWDAAHALENIYLFENDREFHSKTRKKRRILCFSIT